MARPKEPLLYKREVLLTALRIIDEEGLDALSVRRLAAEFGVNGAAFYYHFHNKDEIIAGAAELAFDVVRVPRDSGGDWKEWMLKAAHSYRKVLLAHPELILVMERRGRFLVGLRRVEESIGRLEAQGVPSEATVSLILSLEAFAIGSVLREAFGGDVGKLHAEVQSQYPKGLQKQYPKLSQALTERSLNPKEEFDLGCRGIIDAIAGRFQASELLTAADL